MAETIKINQIREDSCNFTIRGIVTYKSQKKEFNKFSKGTLFYFKIKDETGEIKVIGFTKETEKYFELIQFNKSYDLSNLVVQKINPDFRAVDASEFELKLYFKSIINEIKVSEKGSLADFKFTTIRAILDSQTSSPVDLVAFIKCVGENEWYDVSWGESVSLRKVILADSKGMSKANQVQFQVFF